MPTINVDMLTGRSVEQKRALVRELTDAFVRTCGNRPENVYVVIREVPTENWAAGGQLISDRDGETAPSKPA